MKTRRPRINRVLSGASKLGEANAHEREPWDTPRRLGPTLIDFSTLHLPTNVSRALAEAFWNQLGACSEPTLRGYWQRLNTFARFVAETHAVGGLNEVGSQMLVRYVEWLNRQVRRDGTPWHTATRACAYSVLRTLLRWLQRCRPHVLGTLDFPQQTFPNRNCNRRRAGPPPAQALQAILKACQAEISGLRVRRELAEHEMALARTNPRVSIDTLGGLLLHIDQHYGGVVPPALAIRTGTTEARRAFAAQGGCRAFEPCLYPRPESLFPYYLATLIHAAGNPDAIARLEVDCLQSIPLLEGRELLVWRKGRAGQLQRRSFRTADSFEPPALVREVLLWTQRLRPHVPVVDRNRLFLVKGHWGVAPFSMKLAHTLRNRFVTRHHLPYFELSAIRPAVLTAFYRASGDLRQVKEIANHAHLSTTVGYVQGPEVQSLHRVRVAALQSAFLGHIEQPLANGRKPHEPAAKHPAPRSTPPGTAVSMFGFNCKDPFAGIAPGARAGEVCTHFLGCFTCPNAVITAEPASLARLLQARDHLRLGSTYLHPARWEAIYAPLLRVLEEDILTRFSAHELAEAGPLRSSAPSLPQLR
jgi:hypothetical protein